MLYKTSARLPLGDDYTGVDIDELGSKCTTFMKDDHANPSKSSTQRHRQRRSRRDDDEDEQDVVSSVLASKRIKNFDPDVDSHHEQVHQHGEAEHLDPALLPIAKFRQTKQQWLH